MVDSYDKYVTSENEEDSDSSGTVSTGEENDVFKSNTYKEKEEDDEMLNSVCWFNCHIHTVQAHILNVIKDIDQIILLFYN